MPASSCTPQGVEKLWELPSKALDCGVTVWIVGAITQTGPALSRRFSLALPARAWREQLFHVKRRSSTAAWPASPRLDDYPQYTHKLWMVRAQAGGMAVTRRLAHRAMGRRRLESDGESDVESDGKRGGESVGSAHGMPTGNPRLGLSGYEVENDG